MPIYKNKTLNNISVVINGVRKNIRPGESVSGPDTFKFINGLELTSPEYKQFLPQQTIQNFNIISNTTQNKKYNFIYDNSGNSNFSKPSDYKGVNNAKN